MDGITDAPMRALQGELAAFTYGVSEFLRVSGTPLPPHAFLNAVPELRHAAVTPSGMPVQVQILGGDPERLAESAANACEAGATAIDINFGCPAPTVNRHDGGASLLQHPLRIRAIVSAVRAAVPPDTPVSAKLRLGWDTLDAIDENAAMAAEGGASWLAIHARTWLQGYAPPVYWSPIGRVRDAIGLPVIANGDIWTFEDFLRCQDETGCRHFMLGRGALANPALPHQIAQELGIGSAGRPDLDWSVLLNRLIRWTEYYGQDSRPPMRLKQWLKLAANHGDFAHFGDVKRAATTDELLGILSLVTRERALVNAP
jgi:tRNA-dihydrouridine synthase C